MNGIDGGSLRTALVAAPMALGSAVATPSRRRGAGAVEPSGEVLDDVPYTVLDQAPGSAPSRRPRTMRRARNAAASAALAAPWIARSGQHSSVQRAALRAYAPYQEIRGIYLDVWA